MNLTQTELTNRLLSSHDVYFYLSASRTQSIYFQEIRMPHDVPYLQIEFTEHTCNRLSSIFEFVGKVMIT